MFINFISKKMAEAKAKEAAAPKEVKMNSNPQYMRVDEHCETICTLYRRHADSLMSCLSVEDYG